MIENLQKAVQAIVDGLILKADYTDELEQLNIIENDIAVSRTQKTAAFKCDDLLNKINEIRGWMKQEMKNK